ncbi:MAG: DUF4465 domain-containing protein [Bacteroidales bacterium]|jgi:hypothetical protein
MKQIYLFMVTIACSGIIVSAQSYLVPSEGFKAADVLPGYNTFSAFDIHDSLLYANDGDTIRCLNMKTGQEMNKFGKPAGYASWPSFVTMSPDGATIWAGFTNSGNTDDRIYSIDVETGTWDLQAHLSGNFDLEYWGDSLLVTGLNSSDWEDPTSIFVLDTTGVDNHRKIIEMGGSSAGLATDSEGNVYYGTYFYYTSDPNALYRWDSAGVADVINNGTDTLKLEDATKLTDLPNGAYDCEVDAEGNLLFDANSYSSDKVFAVWNGTSGDGYNFDTLAVATDAMDWLTMIKSHGNILDHTGNNGVYILSWARPVAKVFRSAPPELTRPLGPLSAFESDANIEINLSDYFTDPDDTVSISCEVISNSFDTVASANISNDTLLMIDFLKAGQTNVLVKASSNGRSVTEKLIVGVQPGISGSLAVTDFEDLILAEESYWNGDDGSGGFGSGLVSFHNNYSGGFWDGWAYSNTSDITTAGSTNQYSAITGTGFDTLGSGGKNYGVAFVPTDWVTTEPLPVHLAFSDTTTHNVKGFYVTNSTYSTLSMEQGDAFAKKFGGESGNDPDYFKLLIWGKTNGMETDTIEFFLADYRFEDNAKDYIIKTWQWIELSSLGEIDTLLLSLASSDVGEWGINTPLYFNIDNFLIDTDAAPEVINPIADITVPENSADSVISLAGVFTDSDNDDAAIEKSVKSNSNSTLVSASISGNDLTLSFTADATGETEIVIKGLSNGKAVTDTFSVTVVLVSGIESMSLAGIIPYPNPSDGIFSVRTNSSETSTIKIFTLSGDLVYVNEHYTDSDMIDISTQPPGVYFIRLSHGTVSHIRSIIKE